LRSKRGPLDDPDLKRRYTSRLFDSIAGSYDRFTDGFSFGMDARWKARLLALALEPPAGNGLRTDAARTPQRDDPLALDLACGTGDLALAVAAHRPRVLGLDISPRMLELAASRGSTRSAGGGRPIFAAADLGALPVASGGASLVTAGYALRNAAHLDAALDELGRVAAPRCRVAILDFFLPEGWLWRRIFIGYLYAAGSLVGWLWHRDAGSYAYIARSLLRFVTVAELSRRLRARGLVVRREERRLGGGIGIVVAEME
jgi:demethylmenaquinone methyltransferase / 2-methoxy-6-polyprenyl-1,4-benzoquinol methylase